MRKDKDYIVLVIGISLIMLMSGCDNKAQTVVPTNGVEVVMQTEISTEGNSAVKLAEEKAKAEQVAKELDEKVQAEVAEQARLTAEAEANKSAAEKAGIVDSSSTKYVCATVNVRTDAAVDSDKLGSLSLNEVVNVTGEVSNGWTRIDYNNSTAYVASEYLSNEKTVVSQSASPSNGSTPSVATATPSADTSTPSADTSTAKKWSFPVDTTTREESLAKLTAEMIAMGYSGIEDNESGTTVLSMTQ
ncbi:SH3 domain-containing protein [[Clostridium] fimetarium]|uniref:SH3 domain-containing protein n=1 Tax=[Clostridium] fimetarium TaxID=99656 RepID=A0A1I0RDX9_9FIRM|nr:SH3 domain-containing protein [[Clostridium] fimetarium]SEW38807.1 SH3 domain-containing protein [[Clostridium] fimetarium]